MVYCAFLNFFCFLWYVIFCGMCVFVVCLWFFVVGCLRLFIESGVEVASLTARRGWQFVGRKG